MYKFTFITCVSLFFSCQATTTFLKNEIQPDATNFNTGVVTNIANNKYPYVASILLHNTFRCAGVILNKNWILTLASCTSGHKANTLLVHVGSSYKAAEGEVYAIKKVVNHEKFVRSKLNFDFSVLKVATTMKFNKNVTRIPVGGTALKPGTFGVVIGWGESRTLMETNLTVADHAECVTNYNSYGKLVTKQMMCGTADSSTCFIENGDPLVGAKKLQGIFSWSLNCADRRFPGVYSNVAVVKPWILKHIKN